MMRQTSKILGVDEVGRGPYAGPLVVGAVILATEVAGLKDSKMLTKKRRELLSAEILASGATVGLGWVTAQEIDEIGLSESLRLATRRAIEEVQQSKVPFSEIIIDGTINFLSGTALGKYVTVLKKADQLIAEVSAASIVAKVARDEYMTRLAKTYPGYGFEEHAGYGTAKHVAAIERYGVCPEHRLSFKPLQKYGKKSRSSLGPRDFLPTTKQIGDEAEEAVARMLVDRGHEIVARNWKNRFCEVDIVSKIDDRYYFTEVKYRKDAERGSGLEAITDQKLHQMRLAVEMFAKKYKIPDFDPVLAAASVTDEDYRVVDFLVL